MIGAKVVINVEKMEKVLESIELSNKIDDVAFSSARTTIIDDINGGQVVAYLDKYFSYKLASLYRKENIKEFADFKEFSDVTMKYIMMYEKDSNKVTQDLNQFIIDIKKRKKNNFWVYCIINGFEYTDSEMMLGNIRISSEKLLNKTLLEEGHIHPNTTENSMYASILVSSYTLKLAYEKAYKIFDDLEHILTMLTPAPEYHRIEINSGTTTGRHTQYDIYSKEKGSSTRSTAKPYRLVSFEDSHFKMEDNQKCLSLLNVDKKTEMENKIFNASIWVGKSIKEYDLKRKLVELVYALECLLQVQSRDLVSPGIVFNLGLTASYIVSEGEDKKEIFDFIKSIYAKRSAIVHGRDTEIDRYEIEQLLTIVKKIIFKLLCEEPYASFQKGQELHEWFIEKVVK
ncbi:Uncharacterised protein [Listeria newyorkensis]|nr:Uncharacterised protein [Listeria newyorkensis]